MVSERGTSRASTTGAAALPVTRLEAFMRSHRIRPVALEHASGVTRPHLRRIRLGKADPGRRIIAAITRGCRKLARDARVTALDLFELD